MATLKIIICDLCKRAEENLGYKLIVQRGPKSKGGVLLSSEICEACYADLFNKVNSKPDISKLTGTPEAKRVFDIKAIEDGVNKVPSSITLPKRGGKQPDFGCLHEHTSYNPPDIICKDCNEVLEV